MQAQVATLPTQKMVQAGQSPWLDYLSRDMIKSGKLRHLIEEQGVMGLTSNPSIFQKAISQSNGSYEADIQRLSRKGASTLEIYDALTVADIQKACDHFLGTFKQTEGEHGYVSLEVLPHLAYQTTKTIDEADRLFRAVKRPNLMIKIPATAEGIPAVREVISRGINVNITLMFSIEHYRQVAWAYIEGLEQLKKKGGDLSKVRSVASVFVSRIDTLIDKKLQALLPNASEQEKSQCQALLGKTAVANSKLIYQEFKTIFTSTRFQALSQKGAHPQKVLWGSTSVKNREYQDLLYVEPLIGPETVNTMPQETLDAVLDHGQIHKCTVEENVDDAEKRIQELECLGFNLVKIGDELQTQGVKLFSEAFELLMKTLEKAQKKYRPPKQGLPKDQYFLSPEDLRAVHEIANAYQQKGYLKRFISEDPTLWKTEASHLKSISNRLGWLKVHETMPSKFYQVDELWKDISKTGIKDVLLLGMGGSSLSPEVMSFICPRLSKVPRFRILDSTDPNMIASISKSLNLKKTLWIVASKSGATIETISQYYYFYAQVQQSYGKKADLSAAGNHFVAITDEGSMLQKIAVEQKFRACFINLSNIGGRYSALSLFGLVPAALMGIDYRNLMNRAEVVYQKIAAEEDLAKNPGFFLGIVLGYFATQGKNKLSFILSKSISPFGSWLEQLIAESTGKEKKGILPIDSEAFSDVSELSQDRVFVAIQLKKETDSQFAKRVGLVRKAKFPLIQIKWPDSQSLGGEFLRWEIATVIACLAFQVNPFDEPNVTDSKEITARLLAQLKEKGQLSRPPQTRSVKDKLGIDQFLPPSKAGRYLSILAYIERSPQMAGILERIRTKLRKKYRLPVLFGFGPRYLHSIGQFYKGGTPSGIFIEVVKQIKKDVPVPQTHYGFGQLIQAQAFGDYEAIQNKNLPIMLIDLGKDSRMGLKALERQI